MRKLISPKKIDDMETASLFSAGCSAIPMQGDIYRYDVLNKKAVWCGRIFTTLPYVPMCIHGDGEDSGVLVSYRIRDNWRQVFGEETPLGCCAVIKDEDEGVGVATRMWINGIGEEEPMKKYLYAHFSGHFVNGEEVDHDLYIDFTGDDNYDRYAQEARLRQNQPMQGQIQYESPLDKITKTGQD